MLIPDVSVIRRVAVRRDSKYLTAADVSLVIEVESESTKYRDRRPKKDAYAGARIPAYVRVELAKDGTPTLVVHELTPTGYVVAARSVQTGAFEFTATETIRIDMDELNSD